MGSAVLDRYVGAWFLTPALVLLLARHGQLLERGQVLRHGIGELQLALVD